MGIGEATHTNHIYFFRVQHLCGFSYLIRYSKDCDFYRDVFEREVLVIWKPLNQGFLLVMLK